MGGNRITANSGLLPVFRPESPTDHISFSGCLALRWRNPFWGVLVLFYPLSYPRLMTEHDQKLTPAQPDDLANSLSFALRHEGRKSQHDSDRLNADIVAKRLVRHLDRAGYVVMKKSPLEGHSQVMRGFGQKCL
jgi:hypothetical protein